jgi:hypothetical protein
VDHHPVQPRILLPPLLRKVEKSGQIQFDKHTHPFMLMVLEQYMLVFLSLLITEVPVVDINNNVHLVEEGCNSHGEFISQYQC